jgi:protein O-GlcNAc transferase
MTEQAPSPASEATALYQAALANEAAGRVDAALQGYRAALAANPALRAAAEKLAVLSLAEDAAPAIRLARELGMPGKDRDILGQLGFASFRAWSTHHPARALAALRQWLAAPPDDRAALLEAARYAADHGDPQLALALYERCFAVHPTSLYALDGLVGQLLRLGCPSRARTLLAAVVAQAPAQGSLRDLLGNCLARLGEHAEAERAYREALRLDPADWMPASRIVFSALCRDDLDAAGLLQRARECGSMLAASPQAPSAWQTPGPAISPAAGRRLRVGISSADLHLHPVGIFIAPFFRHHDRRRTELVALADSHARDPLAQELQATADEWRITADLNAADYVERVRALDLDVLIDLSGHTSGSRLLEMSRRLARRQATYLGFAGTTGVPGLDARIADADTEPESLSCWSSEPVLRMEGSYFCFEPHPLARAAARSARRADGPPAFGCCAQLAKISRSAVRLWVRTLDACPEAILRVRCREFAEAATRDAFSRRWRREGGDAKRLELHGWLLGGDHYQAYADIDVVLNTYPFHLATNLCDALWMGVPVVSLVGCEHRSRMALSLCRAAGHPEWCAADEASFIALAQRLIGDRGALARLRAGLRDELRDSPLCAGPDYARRLDAVLHELAAG